MGLFTCNAQNGDNDGRCQWTFILVRFRKLAVKVIMDTLQAFKNILGVKRAFQYSSTTDVDKNSYLKYCSFPVSIFALA